MLSTQAFTLILNMKIEVWKLVFHVKFLDPDVRSVRVHWDWFRSGTQRDLMSVHKAPFDRLMMHDIILSVSWSVCRLDGGDVCSYPMSIWVTYIHMIWSISTTIYHLWSGGSGSYYDPPVTHSFSSSPTSHYHPITSKPHCPLTSLLDKVCNRISKKSFACIL